MPGEREVATVANCLLCDNYHLCVIGKAPAFADVRGRKGTEILNELMAELQLATATRPYRLLFCPTCVHLQTGVDFNEWASAKEVKLNDGSEFSLCR